MTRLAGKVAIVTGGGSGIGGAIARRLVEEGALVAIAGRNRAALELTAAATPESLMPIIADLTDMQACERIVAETVSRFGGLDILINNAGVSGRHGACWEVTPADVEAAMRVNFLAAYACVHHAAPHMIARGAGAIVHIGSMTGKRPLATRVAYAASKMALLGMSRTIALDLAPHRIRSNVISPGPVEGDRLNDVLVASAVARGMPQEDVRAEVMALMPLGTPVTAEEIAAMVAFLCSDDGRHISGEDINMTSGIPAP